MTALCRKLDRCQADARQADPSIEIMTVSTAAGEGIDAWFNWFAAETAP